MSGILPLPSSIRFPAARRTMHPFRNSSVLAFASASTVGARKAANLYEVLRIKETASQNEVKTAYRTLAKRFHPDAGSDGRDFMEIHEAYVTLSDPTARALYDRSIGTARLFAFASTGNRFQTRRRWETDQCW